MPPATLNRQSRAIADQVVELLASRGRLDEPFYTPDTLAFKLALSTRTVRTMLAKGVIPSYRIEGVRRIDPVDVEKYLAGRREAAQETTA